MEKDKVIEEIEKLKTIKEKLQFYNDNFSTLAKVDTHHHQVGFNTLDNKNIFCLCKKCEGLYTLTDFETYRDLRNQETNRIINFFESNIDYIDKVEHFFKLNLNLSRTKTELQFIPDSLDKIQFNEFPYKSHIVDITPQTQKEIDILKTFLKNKLLKNPDRIYNLNQLTFEYRVENLKKFLNVRQEKNRRAELIQAEYDKIDLNKAKNLKTFNISKVLEILKTVDDIIKGKYLNNYTNFSDIEIEILAEDAIKYELYLNSLSDIVQVNANTILTENVSQIKTKNSKQNTISITNQTLNENEINNLLKSTIEDYLDEFKDEINSNGYQILVDSLFHYFTKNEFPTINNKIYFKKINKKRIGWALKELYKCEKTDTIPLEYILFAKNNINLFFNEIVDNDNFRKSKLYKAFTTNPAK